MPARRPRLRPVETIFVRDPEHGPVLVLRDTQGIAPRHLVFADAVAPIVARMTGRSSVAEIAGNVARALGPDALAIVEQLVRELDRGCMLEGPTFEARLAEVKREFSATSVREASHAGGAYPGAKLELTQYIERECMPGGKSPSAPGTMLGLVAPHIDPWRGAKGYGHAYRALGRALPDRAETFVLLGTSHAPMAAPFALTRKSYDTPLGALAPDLDAIATLERAARFDPYLDELNHKREHSIEFQAVFLRHVLGERPARIVPILAGLGDAQASGRDPRRAADVARFVDALAGLVQAEPGKVVVIAGADLAHVGPRFGDPAAHDAGARAELEATDRASLAHATDRSSGGFWEHVARDLDTRRVCGLAPIWTLLEAVPATKAARVLHYEQTVDAEDGSIVSHAAVGFYR